MSDQLIERRDDPRTGGLASGSLGVWAIVFFVMSAAAPLTVVASGAPLTVFIGGIGGPGAMFAAGVVLVALIAAFGLALRAESEVGLTERLAAGAQALWPAVVVASVPLRPRAAPAAPAMT